MRTLDPCRVLCLGALALLALSCREVRLSPPAPLTPSVEPIAGDRVSPWQALSGEWILLSQSEAFYKDPSLVENDSIGLLAQAPFALMFQDGELHFLRELYWYRPYDLDRYGNPVETNRRIDQDTFEYEFRRRQDFLAFLNVFFRQCPQIRSYTLPQDYPRLKFRSFPIEDLDLTLLKKVHREGAKELLYVSWVGDESKPFICGEWLIPLRPRPSHPN